MNKYRLTVLCCLLVLVLGCSSCGLLWGGELTSCQTAKPLGGRREIRKAVLIGDILVFPLIVISLPVDFKTGAIYKPCNKARRQRM